MHMVTDLLDKYEISKKACSLGYTFIQYIFLVGLFSIYRSLDYHNYVFLVNMVNGKKKKNKFLKIM